MRVLEARTAKSGMVTKGQVWFVARVVDFFHQRGLFHLISSHKNNNKPTQSVRTARMTINRNKRRQTTNNNTKTKRKKRKERRRQPSVLRKRSLFSQAIFQEAFFKTYHHVHYERIHGNQSPIELLSQRPQHLIGISLKLSMEFIMFST